MRYHKNKQPFVTFAQYVITNVINLTYLTKTIKTSETEVPNFLKANDITSFGKNNEKDVKRHSVKYNIRTVNSIGLLCSPKIIETTIKCRMK